MRIGELASATQTQSETIRYYERRGLLPEAARTPANYRSYGESHVQRLAFIRHCRALGMTLAEIAALLQLKDAPDTDCANVNHLIDAHIGHVSHRIKELKALEKELKTLRLLCAGSRQAVGCAILSGLEQAARQGSSPAGNGAAGHVPGAHLGVGH